MKYFKMYELVDQKTYSVFGEDCQHLFLPEALIALDDLWEYFYNFYLKEYGKDNKYSVIVNDWKWGKTMQWRGYRTPEKAKALGSPKSLHAFFQGEPICAAFDCKVNGFSSDHLRKIILENQNDALLKRIMRLEGKVSWLHFDLMPVKNRIYVFSA